MIYYFYAREIAGWYLTEYCLQMKLDENDILRWLPLVGAARLSEGFENETETIMGWIDAICMCGGDCNLSGKYDD